MVGVNGIVIHMIVWLNSIGVKDQAERLASCMACGVPYQCRKQLHPE